MSASRDIVITVIITPMCCQQMTLTDPGVGDWCQRPRGRDCGARGSEPGLLADLCFPQSRSAGSSVTAKFICKLQ